MGTYGVWHFASQSDKFSGDYEEIKGWTRTLS